MKRNSKTPDPPPLEQSSTLQHILHHDAMAAIFLLLAAAMAFYLANCSIIIKGRPVFEWYEHLWHLKIGAYFDGHVVKKSLHHLINDGLMAIFFFVVGLEIKRELLVGELASFRRALLPIVAAVGGMVCPALVYHALNAGTDAVSGWGIPMATDIAFALGILAVLGKRVPVSLKVMLAAIAIVDDLGAILVIAIFYNTGLDYQYLALSFMFLGFCFALNRLGIMKVSMYLMIGIPLWYCMLKSGVHATIAGKFGKPGSDALDNFIAVTRIISKT